MLQVRVLALALAGVCWIAPRLATQGADIVIREDFTSSPALRGWQTYGETNLFAWNTANQNLEVTWDSAKENSYFLHSLGATLTRSNDFILRFDLRLADLAVGTQPDKPYTFQMAVGLLNLTNATAPGFLRGTGFSSPNLVEFDYFPDSGFGATVAPTLISSKGYEYNDGGFTFPIELTPGDLYHVEMRFIAAEQTLTTRMTRNGEVFGPIKNATLSAKFSDFMVDHLAISSYSDAGQDPAFAGSVLAHGTVDNLVFVSPPPVARVNGGLQGAGWQVQVTSRLNWQYQLERTTDFQTWTGVSAVVTGTGDALTLEDTQGTLTKAFYRVRAQQP